MKGSCTLIASVVAASAVALSCPTTSGDRDDFPFSPCANQGKPMNPPPGPPSEKGNFSPKFDGLRFIETLVTAHR